MSASSPPENGLVRPAAGALVLTLIAWNLSGWLLTPAMGEGEKALCVALTIFFEVVGFNASAQMSRADGPDMTRQRWFWIAALIMTMGWSIYSAHHAFGVIAAPQIVLDWSPGALFEILKAAPGLVVLTIAAVLVPLLPWAIETTERHKLAQWEAAQEKTLEKARAPLPVAPAAPSQEPNTARQAPAHAARHVANALKRQHAAPPRHRPRAASERQAPQPALTMEEIQRSVDDLTRRGELVSFRTVAAAIAAARGAPVHHSKVQRAVDQLPAPRVREAA